MFSIFHNSWYLSVEQQNTQIFDTPMLKGINEVEARASTSNTFDCHADIICNLDSPTTPWIPLIVMTIISTFHNSIPIPLIFMTKYPPPSILPITNFSTIHYIL
jgi:hypothetical protein